MKLTHDRPGGPGREESVHFGDGVDTDSPLVGTLGLLRFVAKRETVESKNGRVSVVVSMFVKMIMAKINNREPVVCDIVHSLRKTVES